MNTLKKKFIYHISLQNNQIFRASRLQQVATSCEKKESKFRLKRPQIEGKLLCTLRIP